MNRVINSVIVLILITGIAIAGSDPGQSLEPAPMNNYVMKTLKQFPTDGTYTYWWPKTGSFDGATTDVYYQDCKVMRGDPDDKKRSYCCGLTLQVFYGALKNYQEEGHIIPASRLVPEKTSNFKRLWFCPKVNSPGALLALEEYGLGKQIKDLDKAQPGDFIQFWRNNGSGHSVIFIDWERDRNKDGAITGLKYWSTQPATNGIGYRTEPVGDGKKDITKDLIFIGRLNPPGKWAKPE
jgi:hypothetical protein